MKLISICPSNTELCAALQIEDLLIAVDDYSDFPTSVSALPKLGPDLSIDIDALEALQPDLVLASLSVPGMEKNIQALEERQIPHIVFNPSTIEEIIHDILTLGKAVGIETKAKEVAASFRTEIDTYKQIADKIEVKKNLYWEWWPNPLFTPGKNNWLTEISMLAGGRNIFEHVELASIQVQSQDVISLNPDYILLAWVGVAEKRINPSIVVRREGWNELTAIQSNQILVMEEHLYCRPSPRLLEGLRKLAYQLHPDYYPVY
ncbi:MAG: cobalamin-binding protein [Bacillus sp. (in: firmicutes)]